MAVIVKKQGTKVQPMATVAQQHAAKNKSGAKIIGTEKLEQIAVGPPVESTPDQAMVGFEARRVFTDGNYGSYTVGVSLSMPCKPTGQSVEETFAFVNEWVDNKIKALLEGTTAE
jgi:hypothetical protein